MRRLPKFLAMAWVKKPPGDPVETKLMWLKLKRLWLCDIVSNRLDIAS